MADASVLHRFRPALLIGVMAISAWAEAQAVSEIARGHSWVSPYWGYCAPKIVFDGETYYTTGLWGATPETSEGVVYRLADGAWQEGVRLPNIYQPATLLLDSEQRLIAVYTRQEAPAVFLRAKARGDALEMEELPAPPDMVNAYYPGAAIANDILSVAYISIPSYSMYLAQLDLKTKSWTPSLLMSAGQIETKPKTAWTYPVLIPAENGLHVVASNCPDGGEGNSYNQVWYLLYPSGATEAARRELVAESPVGTNAYAMDMAVDANGGIHVVHMWNDVKYGDPLPPESAPAGTYDSYRGPSTGIWTHERLGPITLAGFHQSGEDLSLIMEAGGTFSLSRWSPDKRTWEAQENLIETAQVPAGPSFVDVLRASSGSAVRPEPVLVTDGLLPAVEGQPQTRMLWAVLPRP
ncbi:MAG: hypothetical protein IT364_25650 [Candidatus Hydrogenedentes bacterium]|nr:hypothetical protein [Candidatus Hydrogenedentota bacterium]